jgi:serine/threonine protein kinase
MESDTESWAEEIRSSEADDPITNVKSEQDIAEGKFTYSRFISLLQSLGIDHRSVRANSFGMPIGRGKYFSVYRHTVSAIDYQSMWLSISGARHQLFQRPVLRPNTYVAIKRVNVNEETGEVDISDQRKLFAMCREITTLLHPTLRDHDSIIKLQAIIWENGFGTGYENGPPLWPSLVMEYCDMTLADYQLRNPLTPLQSATIGHKIGDGLDALHSANIFHGDLKSENVLLKIKKCGALEPKLADFGCSITFLDREGKAKYYIAGTKPWCAPEVST